MSKIVQGGIGPIPFDKLRLGKLPQEEGDFLERAKAAAQKALDFGASGDVELLALAVLYYSSL